MGRRRQRLKRLYLQFVQGRVSSVMSLVFGDINLGNLQNKQEIVVFSPKSRADTTLYQERAVFGKMKMDPAKQAQTKMLVKFHRSNGSFPNPLN